MERSWIDTYMSIEVTLALVLGYTIMEYKEVWHYPEVGKWLFRDFILNIVRRKIKHSGFPVHCLTDESCSSYVRELEDKCGIKTCVDRIKNDPAGHYFNRIMANSIWGKWTQNLSSQQELKTCNNIKEYHECLFTDQVKHVSLVSTKLLQVEMKRDRNIEGENHERENSRSRLGGKNAIVGAFITSSARDLMYERYLSKLNADDQLLYTNMDSVIVFHDKNNKAHATLRTSDLLGELKDKYGDVLSINPSCYISEFIAFGPKMYQLIFKDRSTGKIVKSLKTMKGISMKSNIGMFSSDKLPMYRNPIIDFCSILQHGSENAFSSINNVRAKILDLKKVRSKEVITIQSGVMTISITFSKNVFKTFAIQKVSKAQ